MKIVKSNELYGHTDEEYDFVIERLMNEWLEKHEGATDEEIWERRKYLDKYVREMQARSVAVSSRKIQSSNISLDNDTKKLLDKLEKKVGHELEIKFADAEKTVPYVDVEKFKDGEVCVSEGYLNRLAEDLLFDGYSTPVDGFIKVYLNPEIMYTTSVNSSKQINSSAEFKESVENATNGIKEVVDVNYLWQGYKTLEDRCFVETYTTNEMKADKIADKIEKNLLEKGIRTNHYLKQYYELSEDSYEDLDKRIRDTYAIIFEFLESDEIESSKQIQSGKYLESPTDLAQEVAKFFDYKMPSRKQVADYMSDKFGTRKDAYSSNDFVDTLDSVMMELPYHCDDITSSKKIQSSFEDEETIDIEDVKEGWANEGYAPDIIADFFDEEELYDGDEITYTQERELFKKFEKYHLSRSAEFSSHKAIKSSLTSDSFEMMVDESRKIAEDMNSNLDDWWVTKQVGQDVVYFVAEHKDYSVRVRFEFMDSGFCYVSKTYTNGSYYEPVVLESWKYEGLSAQEIESKILNVLENFFPKYNEIESSRKVIKSDYEDDYYEGYEAYWGHNDLNSCPSYIQNIDAWKAGWKDAENEDDDDYKARKWMNSSRKAIKSALQKLPVFELCTAWIPNILGQRELVKHFKELGIEEMTLDEFLDEVEKMPNPDGIFTPKGPNFKEEIKSAFLGGDGSRGSGYGLYFEKYSDGGFFILTLNGRDVDYIASTDPNAKKVVDDWIDLYEIKLQEPLEKYMKESEQIESSKEDPVDYSIALKLIGDLGAYPKNEFPPAGIYKRLIDWKEMLTKRPRNEIEEAFGNYTSSEWIKELREDI